MVGFGFTLFVWMVGFGGSIYLNQSPLHLLPAILGLQDEEKIIFLQKDTYTHSIVHTYILYTCTVHTYNIYVLTCTYCTAVNSFFPDNLQYLSRVNEVGGLKGTVQRTRFFELTIDSETAQGPPTPCNVFSILPSYLRRYSYSKINSPL